MVTNLIQALRNTPNIELHRLDRDNNVVAVQVYPWYPGEFLWDVYPPREFHDDSFSKFFDYVSIAKDIFSEDKVARKKEKNNRIGFDQSVADKAKLNLESLLKGNKIFDCNYRSSVCARNFRYETMLADQSPYVQAWYDKAKGPEGKWQFHTHFHWIFHARSCKWAYISGNVDNPIVTISAIVGNAAISATHLQTLSNVFARHGKNDKNTFSWSSKALSQMKDDDYDEYPPLCGVCHNDDKLDAQALQTIFIDPMSDLNLIYVNRILHYMISKEADYKTREKLVAKHHKFRICLSLNLQCISILAHTGFYVKGTTRLGQLAPDLQQELDKIKVMNRESRRANEPLFIAPDVKELFDVSYSFFMNFLSGVCFRVLTLKFIFSSTVLV